MSEKMLGDSNKFTIGDVGSHRPSFTKHVSLANVRYIVANSEPAFGDLIDKLWDIIWTVGFLIAAIVTLYSRLHLQKTIQDFFPVSRRFNEDAFAETR